MFDVYNIVYQGWLPGLSDSLTQPHLSNILVVSLSYIAYNIYIPSTYINSTGMLTFADHSCKKANPSTDI